jgi:hypothetical protein
MSRSHAPCGGAGGPDPSYPYAGGKIGVWGLDVATLAPKDPTVYVDLMGYCNPDWVSDYTYKNLYARLRFVNKAAMKHIGGADDDLQDLQMMFVSGGTVKPGARVKGAAMTAGEPTVTISYLGANGAVVEQRRARFIPYDHLPGGIVMLPAGAPKSGARARIDELPQVRAFDLPAR